MSTPRLLRRSLLAGGLLAGLLVPSAAQAADPASQATVLSNDRLITFETAFPADGTTPIAVTNLVSGDHLVGIDVRPQNGALYGLGFNSSAGTIRLYALSSRTGRATPLGSPIAVSGTSATTTFGFDFNPAVDRIRVVASTGANLRLNPNDGTAATDTAIPATSKVDGAAYTNNRQNATATTLYTLSGAGNTLSIQNPPNSGTQTATVPVTFNGAAVDVSEANGFDIAPGVDVTTDNAPAPANSSGFVVVNLQGKSILAKVNLTTGAATPVGLVGDGSQPVQGLAIQQEAVAGGLPSVAITAKTTTTSTLRRFNTGSPLDGTDVTITGLNGSELPAGVDYRPQTGQLILLGIDATANTGTLYTLDPQSGAATKIGTAGSVALTSSSTTVLNIPIPGSAIDLPPVTDGYDIDVNPATDKVRVVTGTGLNFRIDPDSGAPVDTDASPLSTGNQPDTAQNPANTEVSGTAYTNAFGQSPTGGVTTQYGISAKSDQLQVQAPPNSGAQTLGKPLKADGTAIPVTSVQGFDVPAAVKVSTSDAPATGTGFAFLGTTGTPSTLYAIDLATGAATVKGNLGTTTPPTSFALGDGPPPAITRPVVVVPPGSSPGTGTGTGTTPKPTTPAKAGFGTATKVAVKRTASKVSVKGPVKVTIKNANAFVVTAKVSGTTPKSGKRKAIKYASKSLTVAARKSKTLSIKLPSAARKVLRTKKRLTIKVTAKVTAPDGKSRTVKKTVVVRRK